MADVVSYKQYNQRQRRAVLETDLSKGMMSTDGAIEDGYLKSLVNCTYEKETAAITPRPGLRLYGTVFPNTVSTPNQDYLDEKVVIKASKQCVENGVTYDQVILCKVDDDSLTKGQIWVLTSSVFLDHAPLEFNEDYTGEVYFADYVVSEGTQVCYFYTAQSPSIHNINFVKDEYRRIEFPVGEFAYGNHYYFFGEDEHGSPGLYRTVFDSSLTPPRYVFEKVEPKELSVSEAVTFGYNMLLDGSLPYTFINKHQASVIQFEGILPYEVEVVNGVHQCNKLMMTPKKNQSIDLVCYYDVVDNQTYDIVWESRETTASDWTQLKKDRITFNSNTKLILENFHAQDTEIMVRVSAYTVGADTIEKAMVVGFDFTTTNYGSATTLEQEEYDLSTATGMESWDGRMVLWGVPKDPTILFISDYNEPAYFPYPNNIVTFDEPIIYCLEFMDSLAVFTTSKLYQVTLADDANSWNRTVLQSNLSIEPWDKHLIQPVRNMLYFKSGNYYYMMVPKAQSTTGALTLAPITTPITSFFDRFSVNVQNILEYAYDYTGNYELLTYFNFLDYEDIHNIYAYRFDDTKSVLHFDVIYNTVDRTWKVWVFEAPDFIYPYKQEATRSGLFASTSVVTCVNEDQSTTIRRVLQVCIWDKMVVRSCYIPDGAILEYDADYSTADLYELLLHCNDDYVSIRNHTLVFDSDEHAYIENHVLHILDDPDFYYGYSKSNILSVVKNVYDKADEYYTFRNYQFIDSGYRKDELQFKKRYREIQLQINNLDKQNMNFGMDYVLDGAPRKILYKYDVDQVIDEMDPEFGIVYIDSTPYMETELSSIDHTNQWTLDQNLTPEVTLWKVRVSISGKGYAPRMRLYSRNEKRFELLNINWISKIMHMR